MAIGLSALAIGIGSYLMPEVHAYTADAFVMVVKTDNPGTSNATSFTIPITGTGYSYNVDCNDDGVNEITARTTSYTCVYGAAGTYTVAITGTFPRIYFNNAGDRQKLLEVKQWGAGAWTSMGSAFRGCNNLHVTATDAPNLTVATDMSRMFEFAISMNENINHWDVSHITNMSYLFNDDWNQRLAFNQPLNNWNTSAVTNMSYMFQGAAAFNQPIETWDTGNVTNMSYMFNQASAFNQPIGGWNTSKLTNARFMFNYALAFNQPINSWSTDALQSIWGILQGARSFNQPLNSWNTSAVTDMRQVFNGATAFNQPLDSWNTSAVTNMSSMFDGATAFNRPLTSFDTSAVTDMSWMFYGATAFNQPLDGWNTSAVTNMNLMFYGATAFNQPLDGWNTGAVTNMGSMFTGATAFNQPLDSWNTGAVTNMSGMLDYSGYTTATYDQTLAHFASQSLQSNVTLGAAGITYCEDTAHITLTSPPNNWTITDGGFCPPAITSPANLAVVSDATPAITGTAKPSRTVHIDLGGSSYTTTASATGDYSFAIPTALTNGWHTATVRSADQAGALGVTTKVAFYAHSGGTLSLSGSVQAPTLTWPAAPNTGVATIWQQTANGATSFPARGSFGAAELNGKLWIVGGQGTSSRLNDVWSSGDGTTWGQALATAPFSKRNAHTVTSFNGKLWVMGGQTGSSSSTRLSDIWSTPDGINWTQETANAPWGPRAAHETVIHDGKIWIMGGADATDTEYADVWNSSDGVNWTKVTDTVNWPPRRGFAAASFNGKLWVMGGLINDWDVFENDVWSSTDGVTWTEETADAAWQVRASHQVEAFDGKLWVLGGSSDNWNSEYSDVWFSENGKDWHRTTEAADWTARRGHSSAVFNNQLWVLGGRAGSGWTTSNDVWSAGIPPVTYTICWDTTVGGCTHTATTTNLTFALPDNLAKNTWHFSVQATGPNAQSLVSFTSSPYTVTDPMPVTVPLNGKPVVHPVTGTTSTEKLSEALTGAVLSVASYDCSDLQIPTVRLIEPDSLKAPQAGVTLLGGVGFSVGCTSNGKATDVSLSLGTSYLDTSKLRAYKQTGTTLTDITNQVTFTNKEVSGATKTVVNYNLVDGGEWDEDGLANGTIVDPIFIGTVDGAGGSLANTGVDAYLITALAGALLIGASLIWRKGLKIRKPVSFR